MALILEVVRADGSITRRRLVAFPLTVGRALSNDVILDDPYVDARHALIAIDDSGVPYVEDLGTVNGVLVPASAGMTGDVGRRARVDVAVGTQLRVGRTMLRFRDTEEDVAPALVDATTTPLPNVAAIAAPSRASRFAGSTVGRVAIAAITAAAFAFYTWLGTSTRATGSEVFSAGLGFLLAAAVWAGLWSVAGRVVVHRFHFVAHLAVISLFALGALVSVVVGEWLAFVFPDATAAESIAPILSLALLGALVAGHLVYASAMPRPKRVRVGAAVVAVVFALGLAATLAKEDTFSDVPRFSGVLKPIAPRYLPTQTVSDFDATMRDLRKDVDALASKND